MVDLHQDLPRLVEWLTKRREAGARQNFRISDINRALYPDWRGRPNETSPALILLRAAYERRMVRPGNQRHTWIDMRHLTANTATFGWRERLPEKLRRRAEANG